MKGIVLIILNLILLITSCTDINEQGINVNTDNIIQNTQESANSNKKEQSLDKIDRSEYLTGEIITDGYYNIDSLGVIYFVPDAESREIMEKVYGNRESYQLFYDDMAKVDNLPTELGIYKVKVKIYIEDSIEYLYLKDIQMTDKIGTVLYEGITYTLNDLDYNVKVKDKICGLIVKWIDRLEPTGIRIKFAGEIESEGYYNIYYNEMYDANIGQIYFDKEYYKNVPTFKGEISSTNFYFSKTNELFDELEKNSSFGRGKFKNSNYSIVYKIGMGREPSNFLTDIISLDENYTNMFENNKDNSTNICGIDDSFVIVSVIKYDNSRYPISFDYYYIDKCNPVKTLLFSSEYSYELKKTINEKDFVLYTDGYNTKSNKQKKPHEIRIRITDEGTFYEIL